MYENWKLCLDCGLYIWFYLSSTCSIICFNLYLVQEKALWDCEILLFNLSQELILPLGIDGIQLINGLRHLLRYNWIGNRIKLFGTKRLPASHSQLSFVEHPKILVLTSNILLSTKFVNRFITPYAPFAKNYNIF